jgi:vacuolar protein sorting-associated protein 26
VISERIFSILAEMFYDRGNHYEFTSIVKEMAPPGEITADSDYEFEFPNVDKNYESYNGINVRLR